MDTYGFHPDPGLGPTEIFCARCGIEIIDVTIQHGDWCDSCRKDKEPGYPRTHLAQPQLDVPPTPMDSLNYEDLINEVGGMF